MIKIESVHVEEMRGIRKLDIDFRREKFAISGPNGSGKSGVIDAIEFGLTGEIGRLSGRGTGSLSVSEHGPHVDKAKFPDVAFVRLRVFLPDLGRSVTITRTISSPKKPRIEPADPAAKKILEEIAEHPEVTLSRREILRFILVEPTRRSEEIQAILKLDEIGQTRATLNTAQNRLQTQQRTIAAELQSAREALQLHLQITTLRSEDLLEAVNSKRKALGLPLLQELTVETKLDNGLADTAKASTFNKESSLRDVEAFGKALEKSDSLTMPARKEIYAGIGRLESDPALLAALQRRSFIEKGMELIYGPECPLCDSPWESEQLLRNHLKEKLAKSEEARRLHEALLRDATGISTKLIELTVLLRTTHHLAETEDSNFARQLNEWLVKLDVLKVKLGQIEGVLSLKATFVGDFLETPVGLQAELKLFEGKLRAKPDQSATLDAQTFLTA